MNFLSHFRLCGHYQDPERTVGKILPDLVRMVDRNWRLHKQRLPDLPGKLHPLAEGINWHIGTDAYFHSSLYFKEKEAVVKAAIERIDLPGNHHYTYFYSHVLLEMVLDRVVMRENPSLLPQFYESLSQVSKATIFAFFQYKQWETYLDRFWHTLQRFIQHAYLYEYIENERLLFALDRVAGRVGLQLFDEPYKSRLMHQLDDIEEEIARGSDAIFEAIENHLIA